MGLEGFKAGGIKERSDSKLEGYRQRGIHERKVQDKRDAEQDRCWT